MATLTTISLQDWIDHLEQSEQSTLCEQIDSAWERGMMSEQTVFALQMYFGLVE